MNKRALDRERRRQERAKKLTAKRGLLKKRAQQRAQDRPAPEVSCTYLLALDGGNYKIGGTQNLRGRVRSHKKEGKLPPFTIYHAIPSNAPLWAERYLHSVFRCYRVGREIFALPDDALAWLKSLARLDRDNEPTPPAFSKPSPPPVQAPKRRVEAKPAPESVPVEVAAVPLIPVHRTRKRWMRGRIPTVWHP